MNELNFLQYLYQPLQPAVSERDDQVIYQELSVEEPLRNYVYCIWQIKSLARLTDPYIYRVVSDGCIDIFFNHKQPGENFVMGFCKKYTEFDLGNNFDYIGVRFLPSAFPSIFRVSASSLSNHYHPLNTVLPKLATWVATTLSPEWDFSVIAELISIKLKSIISQIAIDTDLRFVNALQIILEKQGMLDCSKELVTGLSPRQMRRIFNYYIGTTPKAFSNVIRFQQVLKQTRHNKDLEKNKIYLDLGFFDQAHFIKDFKRFYGVTPSRALD